MKILRILLCILLPFLAQSQTFNISDYTRGISTTNFTQQSGSLSFYAEIPPWVVKGGWYQYYFTTHYTGVWSSTRSLATPYNETLSVGSAPNYGHGPKWNLTSLHWWGDYHDPNYLASPSYIYHNEWKNLHWRRNYNGIFSSQVIHHPGTDQVILFAISHGENKNEKIGNYLYQNTVRPSWVINANDPATFSGDYNGTYQECWEAYFGFLNANWLPYNEENDYGANYLNDLGPIGWPSAGYVNSSGGQTSYGLRHPSSIVYGHYVYIFVKDESHDVTGGIKCIRVHDSNIFNPNAYETWSVNDWIPSLPAGFNKDQAAAFFSTRGPQSTPVFPNDMNTIRFSVAKFKNTNRFIGLELYFDGQGKPHMAYRLSTNLIDWSDRVDFYAEDADWSSLRFKYPIFLSADGTSNVEIDENEFYIIGTSWNNSINKMHFVKNSFSFPLLAEQCPPNQPCVTTKADNSTSTFKQPAAATVKAYPNPVRELLNIVVSLPQNGNYTIGLYNSFGQLVKIIDRGNKTARDHNYRISTSELTSGTYFVVVSNNNKPMNRFAIVKQ
ncbi:T9SS type A sorting domain-containing protein [Longitalea luteola]|uniref:T9SS type A sorting domain-containing protein n=1 Tax=Longitalea luteola TaxID=2812563 RepID=UPI001A975989|nr:T9SS type A sorting domain-containing protein [Longitalea luteola]